MKKCITCGEMFEDFGASYFISNVCQECFVQSCREVDETYEKKKDDTNEETI